MPLQPSRRDSATPQAFIRHHESYLRGLNPGYLGGRFATPQLVQPGPSILVGGDEGGGDDNDASVIGEDGDRLTLTHLGTQPWRLSYLPIAETLHVHWHPGAGAGVEWKRGEHYFIDDDDQVITIYASTLASAKALVGDVFSAQYLHLEGEQTEVDPVEFKAGVYAEGTGSAPSGPLALPAEAEVGDLVVISGAGVDVTDPRFAVVGSSQTWVGYADTLDGIDYTNTGFHWTLVAAVFTPGEITATASASGSSNPGTLPQLESAGIVIAGLSGSTGSLGTPTGFTEAVSRNQGVAFAAIAYLHVEGTSPAAEFTTGGVAWLAGVLSAPWMEVPA